MNIATFTLTILITYLIGLKIVSIAAHKISKNNSEDFFLSGRNVGLIALIGTTIASVFSTGTVIGAPSKFFSIGFNYLWAFGLISVPIALYVFGKRIWEISRTRKYITPGDLLGDFYKSKTTKAITGIIGVIALVPYAAAQLVAIGKTFEALTAGLISYQVGVSVISISIAMYLYFGGARAVVWTDMVQGLLFATLIVISGGLIVHWAGNPIDSIQLLQITKPELTSITWNSHFFELLLLPGLSFIFLPYIWQRIYMAKSKETLKKTCISIFFAILGLFGIMFIIGISGHILFPEGLADSDNLLGAIFNAHAPYFGALVLIAAFAAGMSTVDSQMLSSGSIISHDISPLFKYHKHGKEYKYGKIATLFLLGAIFVWSLYLKDKAVFNLILTGIWLSTGFIVPTIAALYWKRGTALAANCSMITTTILYFVLSNTELITKLPGTLFPGTWALISGMIIFITLSIIQKPNNLHETFQKNI